MPEWKIGYPAGLSAVASDEVGKELYNPILTNSANLSLLLPEWAYFKVVHATFSGGQTTLESGGTPFTGLTLTNGTCSQRAFGLESATVKRGIGGEIISHTNNEIVLDGDRTSDFPDNSWALAENGSSTILFNTDLNQFNAIRKETKHGFQDAIFPMPFLKVGVGVPLGRAEEAVVFILRLRAIPGMTAEEIVDTYKRQLLKRLDFQGRDAHISHKRLAPQILDTGHEQIPIFVKGVQPVQDPKSIGTRLIDLKVEASILWHK